MGGTTGVTSRSRHGCHLERHRGLNPELAQAVRKVSGVLPKPGLGGDGWDQVRLAVAGANSKTDDLPLIAALDGAWHCPRRSPRVGTRRPGHQYWHADSPFVIPSGRATAGFLVYHPHVAAITNVQPDHLGLDGTFDNVRPRIPRSRRLPPSGLVVACADDEGIECAGRAGVGPAQVLTYGHALHADLVIPRVGVGEHWKYHDVP